MKWTSGIDLFRRELAEELKAPVAVVVAVFLLGAVAGARSPEMAQELAAAFAELAREMMELGPVALIAAIFVRNALAVGSTMLFGVAFGVVPLLAALSNGLLVGYILSFSPGDAWKLIPHGLFELPAVFIGWGLGLWCGLWILRAPRWMTLKHRITRSFQIYFTLILPLLAVAAVIEGTLAAWLLG